jgi:hypothetical protein
MPVIVIYGNICRVQRPHRFRGVVMTVVRAVRWRRSGGRSRVLVAALAALTAASTLASAPSAAATRERVTSHPQAPVGTAHAGSSQQAVAADAATPMRAAPAVVTQLTTRVDMCGGALPFGQVAVCSAISGTEQHVYTVSSTVDSDILATQLTRGSGQLPSASITGPDGMRVCGIFLQTGTCQLGAAGTYTITVSLNFGGTGDYTLALESMRTPSSCTTLPSSFFSWAAPALTATLAAGTAAHCYQFSQPVGAVLHLKDPSSVFEDVRGEIRDAQYQPLCPVDGNRLCTLSQPGPYRLFVAEFFGRESTYTLRMPRLSNSFGCPKLKLARFGDPAPDAIGTVSDATDATCHKLTNVGPGPVVVRLNPATTSLGWALYNDAGEPLCFKGSLPATCDLPQHGDYTLVLQSDQFFDATFSYQIAVTALYRWTGCAFLTGTSWNVPTLTVHPNTPVSTHCQPFFGRAGDRIVHYGNVIVHNDLRRWLVDQNGVTVCPTGTSGQDGCVLPATGIYRLMSYLNLWDPNADPTYKLQVRRLSDPRGCPAVVRPGNYGAAPAGPLGANRCRILDITTAGTYRVKAVDATNVTVSGQFYDAAGLRKSCSSTCNFSTPGRYTFIVSGGLVEQVQFAFVLLPAAPTVESGCVPVSGTGYAEPAHRGEFTAAGQINCLEIVTDPRPALVQLLPGEPSGAARPVVNVVNIGGTSVCDATALRRRSCVLGPTTPYIVLLVAPEGTPTGSYAMAFARVNGPPACQTLPAGADGVTVTTNADQFAACYSIAADEHAAQEVFSYQRTSGTGNAIISVFNAAGTRICGPTAPTADRTVTCNLPAGPVTVIVEADATDATYQLTRNTPG